MNQPLKDPKGGLTPAGRKAFGGNLKPGVKNYSSASDADKRRWISWALRFYGQKEYPPLVDDKGRPTRFALTAAAWGEPVPKTEADARAIAAKARKRKQEMDNKELTQSYLEHYGVKGMKWGVRRSKKEKSGKVKKVAKSVGAVAAIGGVSAGVYFTNRLLKKHGAKQIEAEHVKKLAQAGFAWKKDNGPWNYEVPGQFLNEANRMRR